MSTEIAPQDTILELSHLSPLICVELAAGLSDPEDVCKKYGISEEQWVRLKHNPTFVGMMKEAEAAFTGSANAGKRITKKAEVLLEEALPILYRIMTREDASTQAVLDTVKQLTVLAGRTQRKDGVAAAGGSGFNVAIHINTGDGNSRIEGEIIEHDPD